MKKESVPSTIDQINELENEDQEEIKKFLQENSFGILINQTNGKLWATHIPL